MMRNPFRTLTWILGAFAATALASHGAMAAVTVLGSTTASSCYRAAEFGGNAKDGIALCTEALEQETLTVKDRAATFVNRGILLSRNDEPDAALADYDKGLSLDATLGEGYVDRGAVLIVLKRYDDALNSINRGIALGASRLQIAYYDRALVEEAMGNVRAAYEDYKMATQIEPGFALASAQLGRFKVIRHHTDGT